MGTKEALDILRKELREHYERDMAEYEKTKRMRDHVDRESAKMGIGTMARPSDDVTRRFLDYVRANDGADYAAAWDYAYAKPEPKILVTDDMVERGVKYVRSNVTMTHAGHVVVKHFLDSVLNPPPEPKVEVTREMVSAAQRVSENPMGYNWADIYRAMRRLEPKP